MVGKAIMRRVFVIISLVFFVGLYPGLGLAMPKVDVTDVTPRAFSLVWLVDQAATCSAKVYSDPVGQKPVAGLTITSESAGHPPAEQNGVMKVNVTGLTPGTTYYFQIVTITDAGTLTEPVDGELPSVRTETSSGLVNNDVLAHRILLGDGSTPAVGALLLVEVEGADYPITGWVDEGFDAPWALVNLNNLYGEETHTNLELSADGGETITLTSIGGLSGFRRLSAQVPEEIGVIQSLDPFPSDDQCTLDDRGPTIDTEQLLPFPGEVLGENRPLIRAGYSDQYSEISVDSVRLYVDGEDVTIWAVVNPAGVEYRPGSDLSDGPHTVRLTVSDEWGYAATPVTWSFTVETAAPTAGVSYSTSTPTTGVVVVTLDPSEPITVTNNDGLSYTFYENGTFTFEFVDQAGKTGSTTATVRWIVKPPRGLRIDRGR